MIIFGGIKPNWVLANCLYCLLKETVKFIV